MKAKDTFLNRKFTLNSGARLIHLDTPAVMGIINATPDSFHAPSRKSGMSEILHQAEIYLKEGASWLDVGGYSSRPGAAEVSLEEELERVIPPIHALAKTFPEVFLSVDTFRSVVAKAAIQAGAHVINDISGGGLDPDMFRMAGELRVPYLLMHMRGNPKNMQQQTNYTRLIPEIMRYFEEKIQALQQHGIKDILLDPGFGFAKTLDQNYQLLESLEAFHRFERPLLVGLSRKSMITKLLHISNEEALNGTSVLHTIALLKGARLLRVHDAKAAVECLRIVQQLQTPPIENTERYIDGAKGFA